MRCHLSRLLAALLLLSLVPCAHADDEAFKSGPQPGTRRKPNFVPGTFQVWMVTGPQAIRYHSVVGEHGLNPVALVFVPDVDPEDKVLCDFLKGLDELTVKHPDARFGVATIILNDGGFRDALEKDDADFSKRLADTARIKDDLEAKLRELAKTLELKKVVFCLDTKTGPKDYELSPDAQITILVYNKHQILQNFTSKDKLTKESADKLLAEIEKLVLEVERLSRPRQR
jgi:hypothetical protein